MEKNEMGGAVGREIFMDFPRMEGGDGAASGNIGFVACTGSSMGAVGRNKEKENKVGQDDNKV